MLYRKIEAQMFLVFPALFFIPVLPFSAPAHRNRRFLTGMLTAEPCYAPSGRFALFVIDKSISKKL